VCKSITPISHLKLLCFIVFVITPKYFAQVPWCYSLSWNKKNLTFQWITAHKTPEIYNEFRWCCGQLNIHTDQILKLIKMEKFHGFLSSPGQIQSFCFSFLLIFIFHTHPVSHLCEWINKHQFLIPISLQLLHHLSLLPSIFRPSSQLLHPLHTISSSTYSLLLIKPLFSPVTNSCTPTFTSSAIYSLIFPLTLPWLCNLFATSLPFLKSTNPLPNHFHHHHRDDLYP
jgi:hypothetical protein